MGFFTSLVEFTNFNRLFIKIVRRVCIDPHHAAVLAEPLPVGAAATDGRMVDADHPIDPDTGFRLA